MKQFVRPRKTGDEVASVQDVNGRTVPYKEEGVEVEYDVHLRRSFNEGSLAVRGQGGRFYFANDKIGSPVVSTERVEGEEQ